MAVEVGLFHTCALTVDGEAYCWGSNEFGQLGSPIEAANCPSPFSNGDQIHCVHRPRPVSGGLRFSSLSAGAATCGLTVEGDAYCWGYNQDGRLGDGTTTDSHEPVRVVGGHRFQTLSVSGSGHVCGLSLEGDAYCWGSNEYDQLGTTAPLETCIRFIITGDEEYPCSTRPVRVGVGLAFASLATGGASCGVTPAGEGHCWGASNQYGQIGNGVSGVDAVLTPAPVVGGVRFDVIDGGSVQTCGLASGGAAYCWGRNRYGSLGIGRFDGDVHTVPEPVSGGLVFTGLSAGYEYTCGVTTEEQAYCWGINGYYGHLGTGSDIDAPSPVRVAGGIGFVSVSATLTHTCGLGTDHRVYCWGANDVGQGGRGAIDDRPHPVPLLVTGQH